MVRHETDRRTRLADAAIEIVGEEGLRALTHRAVDRRTGLPQGTCGYHYPSRGALLAAALRRIAELDRADMAGDPDPAEVLAGWVDSSGTRTRARMMLMLDPQARAELGEVAGELADAFVEQAASIVGSRERARLAIALVDGLVLDELVRGTLPDTQRRRRLHAVLQTVVPGQ